MPSLVFNLAILGANCCQVRRTPSYHACRAIWFGGIHGFVFVTFSSMLFQCRESDLTARENLLKPDFAGYASPGPVSNVGTAVPPSVKRNAAAMTQRGHPPKQETHYATSKAKKKSKAAKPSSRVPQSKKQPKPKPTPPRSKGRTTPPLTTKTLGAGPSHAVMSPAAAGPSRPANRISSPGASQAKSVQQFIPLKSPGSEYASVKWQNSQKSRSFTQTVSAASTKEEYSEVQRKAAAVKSQERTPVPSKLQWSSSQGRKQSPSLSPSAKQSRPMSSPASIRASSTSPTPRTHISVAVGPSDLHSVSVAAGPSEAGVTSTVAGPSKPASWVSHLTSDRRRSAVAPTKQERQGRSSPPHSQMTDLKPQEIKSHSSRQKSWSPSPKRGGPISPSRSRKEQPKPVPVRRTAESVAVGPSEAGWKTVAVGPSLPGYSPASKPQSQPSKVGKQSDTKSKSQKAKSKERSQSSSATEKQQKIGAQDSENKDKLKSALSAARNKSSLTFITIYSILSSSFDKIKRSRSKDDNVKADDKNVARKPSKRVTISGVIGPSGKSVLQQEEEATNPHGSTGTDVDTNIAALKEMETEELRPPESHLSKNDTTSAGKIPAVEGNISEIAEPKKPESQIMARDPLVTNPEEARKTAERSSIQRLGNQGASQVTSRTPEKLGGHVSSSKSSSKTSQLKTSQKSLPNREVPRNAERDSLPPRSKISVATGQSAVQIVSVGVGLSVQETINKKQTSKPSQQQSRKGDSQKSGSKLSAVLGSPFKSRASVGVGRSAVETRSMGVGRSLVDRVSQGAGPSKPTSKMGQRSQGKNLSKSQQYGFGELEAKPIAKTMSSQKSKTAATSRPASSSHEPRDPSDMSRL